MALKEPFMVKQVIGNQDLTLEAKTGESLLIKDIQIYNPADDYIKVTIEKTLVGYFRVGGVLGNHLPFLAGTIKDSNVAPRAGYPGRKTLLSYLFDKGIFKGFPVAEGQTFKITGAAGANAVQLVIYEVYEAGDQTPDKPNGSESKEYFYINYGRLTEDVTKSGTSPYSISVTPAEFPQFPFGVDVPAKHEISIHGVLASDYAPASNDGTNYAITKYLKFVKERTTLFDEDKNGLLLYSPFKNNPNSFDLVGAGLSRIGNYSTVDFKEPLIFPSPLVFTPGEELNIFLDAEVGGSGVKLTQAQTEIGLIITVKRVE